MSDHEKTFLQHLEDLRWVIIKSAIVLIICTTITCIWIHPLMQLLHHPFKIAIEEAHSDVTLITYDITDSLILTFEVGIFAGFVLSFPLIAYFIGQFLLPALAQKEQKILIPIFIAGGILFLTGVLFCYFLVLPPALTFFYDFNQWLGWKTQWNIKNYLDFVLQMLIAFGISFETPLVIFILSSIGIISPRFLKKYRRHAIVVILILAAIITPTGDPYNLSMLFFPMYFLYEISIFASSWVENRKLKAQKANKELELSS